MKQVTRSVKRVWQGSFKKIRWMLTKFNLQVELRRRLTRLPKRENRFVYGEEHNVNRK